MAKGAKTSAKARPNPAAPSEPEAAPGLTTKAAKSLKPGKEKTIQTKTRGPFVVGAREEEMDMVARETHSCGGGFEIEMEEVRAPTETAGPMDVVKTTCSECGAHVDFLFDISSFYDDEESKFEAAPGDGDDAKEGEDDEGGGWLS